ncbi:hypothetical protein BDQ17DRAFT_1327322 [Cyathus striatus]|nr:hypothetical protein BDQ17DRAFT_1327322 [Cyathus striatus]
MMEEENDWEGETDTKNLRERALNNRILSTRVLYDIPEGILSDPAIPEESSKVEDDVSIPKITSESTRFSEADVLLQHPISTYDEDPPKIHRKHAQARKPLSDGNGNLAYYLHVHGAINGIYSYIATYIVLPPQGPGNPDSKYVWMDEEPPAVQIYVYDQGD